MNAPVSTIITRRAPVAPTTWNADAREFQVVFSTGAGVERYDARGPYTEVLSLSQAWPEKVPFLDAHRRDSLDAVLGFADRLSTVGGEARAHVRLSRHSDKADRLAAELSDGNTFGVSVGYTVQEFGRETIDQATGRRTKVATRWTPLEISVELLPADRQASIRTEHAMTVATNPVVEPGITTPAPGPAPTTTAAADRATVNAEIRGIAGVAQLDQRWIDTQIDANATTEQARAAAFDAMRTRSAAAMTVRNTTATIVTDHTDPVSIRSAMADALAHRLAPGVVKLEGRGLEYRGVRILNMVGEMAVASGERINLRNEDALLQRAIGAHSTSDFPLLLSDATNKALLAQYQVAAPTYRKFAARKPFTDFKDHQFLRVGDFPAFKEINEGGEVKYGTISESAEKVRAKELGTGIAIGRRALINDDLSALSDFSAMIAARAAGDENRLAYGALITNGNLSDGKALFHTDHGNKAAAGTVLDGANVAVAVAALRGQKSLDGLVLNLQPAFLVVGPQQEVAARQLLATIVAAKASDVNVWSNFAELIVDAEITDKRWYVFGAPGAAPVIVYGYVAGSEGPQVRTERDFDTQAVKVAASLDFATGAIDFRGAYFNAGA